jgi:hypothetical protein
VGGWGGNMISEGIQQEPPSQGVQITGNPGLNVVLGAESPLGWVLAEILASESKEVRAVFLERRTGDYGLPQTQKVVIDALTAGNVVEACKGAGIIYDCYEPSYASRKEVWTQVTSNVLLASIEVSAPLIFASHLLNSESENATMEGDILSAHSSSLVPTVVARLPQLIGVRVINPLWKLIYDSVLSGKKAHWVGDSKVPRSFLDVDDAARAMILLGGNAQRHGRAWNIAGPEAMTGSQFIELAFRAMGREPKVGSWGRGVFLTGALSSEAREMTHMPYDYYSSFILEGNEFAEAFPSFRFATPYESVSKGIEWYKAQVKTKK